MQTQAPPRDPRGMVTPDAFEVSEELLGLPLATPSRRLFAMMVDLVVIGLLTVLTSSFELVLGVVAAVAFIRAGFKRTPVKGSVFGRAMRLSVGCLGVFIGVVTAALWFAFGFTFGPFTSGGDDDADRLALSAALSVNGDDIDVLSTFRGAGAFLEAESEDEAVDAARALVDAGRRLSLPDETIREMLNGLAPADADWTDDLDRVIATAMEEAEVDTPPDPTLADVAGMSLADALQDYERSLRSGELDPEDPRIQVLRARIVSSLGSDTLRVLEDQLADAESLARSRGELMDDLTARLERAEEGGSVFSSLRTFVDELGFGFGWASLYLTIILSWWNGQTIGKKVAGIRVLRLDGEPITWWIAFERAGGYAAGFATGLLGFFQVYWDANRQAIHDRIVGTVVVIDGAEPIGNWEATL